jgi:hypothetical protein
VARDKPRGGKVLPRSAHEDAKAAAGGQRGIHEADGAKAINAWNFPASSPYAREGASQARMMRRPQNGRDSIS